MSLKAYTVSSTPCALVNASPRRDWMDAFQNRHPYRCLPIAIANSWGWNLLNRERVVLHWTGGPTLDDLTVEGGVGVVSNFSRGIITFETGLVFHSEPGLDLHVSGPKNAWKDGVHALDAIVETEWCPYSFTVNWIQTRPGTVIFEKGESIACLSLVPRAAHDDISPQVLPIDAMPADMRSELREWTAARDALRAKQRAGDFSEAWQGYYMRNGRTGSAYKGPDDHRTKARSGCPVNQTEK